MCASGLFNHPLFNRHLFATPAVRHLAWLVHSRSLLRIDTGREACQPWPADIDAMLLELDRNPRPLLAHLARRPTRRLGLYFEQLYGYALVAFLGQRILAQNLPVRVGGRTLGELDFLVHDPFSDRVVHHEIAVKFYMGWTGTAAGGKPPGWYGPDTRDQLSTKLRRLREHQIPMWRSEAGRQCLREQGLAEPQASHLGLYGYLFQHRHGAAPPLPDGIGRLDTRITWRSAAEPEQMPSPETFQTVLTKPDWLGPMQYPAGYEPDPGHLAEALNAAHGRSVLLATLQRTDQGFWLESARQFLTPQGWCQQMTPPGQ
jgi:hypothetical protein